jgi:hypothetical protein
LRQPAASRVCRLKQSSAGTKAQDRDNSQATVGREGFFGWNFYEKIHTLLNFIFVTDGVSSLPDKTTGEKKFLQYSGKTFINDYTSKRIEL